MWESLHVWTKNTLKSLLVGVWKGRMWRCAQTVETWLMKFQGGKRQSLRPEAICVGSVLEKNLALFCQCPEVSPEEG